MTSRSWSDEEFRLADWLSSQCATRAPRAPPAGRAPRSGPAEGRVPGDAVPRAAEPACADALRLGAARGRPGRRRPCPAGAETPVPATRTARRRPARCTRLTSNKIQVRARASSSARSCGTPSTGRPDIDAAGHALSLDLPADPVWAEADSERLAQVVTNLLNNAIRYTPAGGRIRVGLTTTPAHAQLTVSDSGTGLAAGDLERVFEMFMQVGGPGSSGLGIGLALVRASSNFMAARSKQRATAPGAAASSGSPCRSPLPSPTSGPLTPAVWAGGEPRRVLVVDDNADAAAMLSVLLRAHGHEVRVANDAEDALDATPTSRRTSRCSISGCPTSTATTWRGNCALRPRARCASSL